MARRSKKRNGTNSHMLLGYHGNRSVITKVAKQPRTHRGSAARGSMRERDPPLVSEARLRAAGCQGPALRRRGGYGA